MRQYLQTNDMLWKLKWNSCQWYDIRSIHLHGCYRMQVVCYKFTMATMNAMYNFSIFLLLPMDIVCSWYVWSRSRHKLGTRTSMWEIGICDMMAHVLSITCKIWFWIRHKLCKMCCTRSCSVGGQYGIIPCPVFVDVCLIHILNWIHGSMKLKPWAYIKLKIN